MFSPRLSDSERRELKNKLGWLEESKIKRLEERYGEEFSRRTSDINFEDMKPFGAGLGIAVLGGAFLYASSFLLYSVGFPTTFHFHMDTMFSTIQQTWEFIKFVGIPMFFTHFFNFVKGVSLGIVGIGLYKCAEPVVRPMVVKINGKEVNTEEKKQ
jgi:hypothetical protein